MKKAVLNAVCGVLAMTLLVGFKNFIKFSEFEGEISASQPYSSIESSLSVGDFAPDFELSAANGDIYRLAQFRNKQHVLVLFYRGAWCPYCVSHLKDIQNLFPSLQKYNVQLLAISKDTDKKSAKLAKKFDAPYIFLADTDLKVTSAFGIKNEKDLPHPAVYLIDKQGKLVWYHIDQEYSKRASGLQLKAVLDDLLEQ